MTKRWIQCAFVATAVVASLTAWSTAAPVLKDDSAVAPIDNSKRAEEIIGYGSNPTEKKSSELPKNDAETNRVLGPSLDGGEPNTKADKRSGANSSEEDKSEPEPENSVEVDPNERDYETYDSVSNESQMPEDVSADDEERLVGAREDDDHYGVDEDEYGDEGRRRRRSVQKTVREERSVGNQPVAMVSENMVAPANGVLRGRQQRSKRELDGETIRELIEASRTEPEPAVGYSDYDQTPVVEDNEYISEQNPEEISVDGQEDLNNDESEEITPWSENEFTEDDRRPKRQDDDDVDEEEEAYEEAEREAVRELLAERAAEETRQALLAFLSSNEHAAQNVIREPERTYRLRDNRFDQEDDDEETAYADDDEEDEEGEDEENEDDEQQQVAAPEEIDESDERVNDGPFLVEEEPEKQVEKKRFAYPYSYEPYGGRWGALVPGAKREDRDPYDRLYRLAEALSRPTSIGDDEK